MTSARLVGHPTLKKRIRQETNSTTLRNIGFVIAGMIALSAWRSWVGHSGERSAAQATALTETAQQGLLNDRYQQGAEMLGNDVLSVRLGGIYALQRLAEEHPEQYSRANHATLLCLRA